MPRRIKEFSMKNEAFYYFETIFAKRIGSSGGYSFWKNNEKYFYLIKERKSWIIYDYSERMKNNDI